jgi:hypothetical protein
VRSTIRIPETDISYTTTKKSRHPNNAPPTLSQDKEFRTGLQLLWFFIFTIVMRLVVQRLRMALSSAWSKRE